MPKNDTLSWLKKEIKKQQEEEYKYENEMIIIKLYINSKFRLNEYVKRN